MIYYVEERKTLQALTAQLSFYLCFTADANSHRFSTSVCWKVAAEDVKTTSGSLQSIC